MYFILSNNTAATIYYRKQFGEPSVDPDDFRKAWIIVAEQQKSKGVWDSDPENPENRLVFHSIAVFSLLLRAQRITRSCMYTI
jgi:hypothetical protein